MIIALAGSGIAFGQAERPAAPPQKPQANPENPALRSHGQSDKATSEESLVNKSQLERLTNAADKVLNRIQNEENDLYLRVNYFEKPDRLDPNSWHPKRSLHNGKAC